MNQLAVSVIMSVKNGMPYIGDTVKSILNQTLTDFEFIIVDDGSTDETVSVLKEFDDPRIKLICQENTGVAKAKNRAIAASQGKYLAIIDADDICMPDRLEKQSRFLDKHQDYVLVGGYVDIIDKDGAYIYTEKKPLDDEAIRLHQDQRNPWSHSAVMFTRSAFDKVGGYYEPVKQYIVDYMLMYQLSLQGKVHQLPEVVVQYRIVPTALSAKANPKEFDEITHRAIRAGTMTESDLKRMKEIKKKEKATPNFKVSMYHLYLGRSFLFHNYQPKKAKRHLRKCLEFNPRLNIARYYLWMCRFLPQKVIVIIYSILSPNAGLTYVRQ
jgi:glycosyltransferase involved in cell wall biosynthesis